MRPTKEARVRFIMGREKRYLADLARLHKAEAVVEAARAMIREERPNRTRPSLVALANALAEYDREIKRWATMKSNED